MERFRDNLITSLTMAKPKAKRKQQDLQNGSAAKKMKISPVTPPADAAEYKTVTSLGLEEADLEIAIDTLNTLAEHPNVIKSKACKDLRTAVYEFRKACTTGLNAGGRSNSAIFATQLTYS